MSAGNKSGVHWMRAKRRSISAATDFAKVVLPTPGTSSSNTDPPAKIAVKTRSITACLSRMTDSKAVWTSVRRDRKSSSALESEEEEEDFKAWLMDTESRKQEGTPVETSDDGTVYQGDESMTAMQIW